MKTTPMSMKALKALAGKKEADRRAEAAAATIAAAAAERGLLDVALGVFESPVGELLLAVTPRGLAYVAFEEEERDDLLGLFSRRLSPRILEHAASTDEVRRQLDEYFAGDRTRFELKLDRRLMRGIARDVLAATARVPFGRTTTYRAPRARSATPSVPTRSRSWCRATGCSAPVATSAGTPEDRPGSAASSPSKGRCRRRRHDELLRGV
jgi:methylated-DNA-[protein]-cysteine S-methyltransferase